MNNLTEEEQALLNHLAKPRYKFSDVQKKIDEMAQENGYKDHEDFLIKSGWLKKICEYDFSKVRNTKFNIEDTVTFELRGRDE